MRKKQAGWVLAVLFMGASGAARRIPFLWRKGLLPTRGRLGLAHCVGGAKNLCNEGACCAKWTTVMTHETDDWGLLLRAALDGDDRSYAQFLRVVTPVLRSVVRARGAALGEAACEDVLQDVLLAVHLKRHTWQAGTPARPWLYAIARYKVIDAFRARGRRVDLPIDDFAEVLPADSGPDPTQAADMEKMIMMLDPRAQRLVRQVGIEGDTMAEAGAKLDMTEGAARVALHRAFKQLAALRKRHVE